MKRHARNVLAVTAGLLCAALVIVGLEQVAGVYLFAAHKNAGLLWGPNSTVEHATHEFHYVARMNNLGFRDRDFSRSKSGARRVAVLGDSFTYGWGLDIEQSWPRVLEGSLRGRGLNVEVANLGFPGAGPADYADLAPRALASLRPDFLLVAVLQADDLLQCDESAERPPPTSRKKLGSALCRVFPNLAQLAGLMHIDPIHVTAQELRQIWKDQVKSFTGGFTGDERARFDLLPAEARDWYGSGDLNPGLLYFSIRKPRFPIDTANLELESTKREIAEMARRLAEIRDVAADYGARVIVASIPYRTYVNARDVEAMRALGFQVESEMVDAGNPDEAIRRAARRAGLRFVQVTAALRRQATGQDLYFHLDGHFNAAGAAAYGNFLAGEVATFLR